MNYSDNNSQLPFDRRKETRIPLVISIKELSSEGTTLSLSSDISSSGMAVKRAAHKIPRDGEKIILEFSLPGTSSLITVSSTYLRAEKNEKVQDGVVIFDIIPTVLGEWISWASTSPGVFAS